MKNLKAGTFSFRPRARMLLLLGDQLIRDAGIAVFELVKNSYDADATQVTVAMKNVESPASGTIRVRDNGSGMDWSTVTEIWLEPGTDHRAKQKASGFRTPEFHRVPMGEKGVGRFAAHKLGHRIQLVTRAEGKAEVAVNIDWRAFQTNKYLEDVPIDVQERDPEVFVEGTGTQVYVSDLNAVWTRGMVRDLARSITSICSPFEAWQDFRASLVLKDHEEWLEGLITVEEVKDLALFRAKAHLEGESFTYDYRFTPPAGLDRVEGRHIRKNKPIPISDGLGRIDLSKYQIGPIKMDLYVYDRDPKVLSLSTTDKKGLRNFLDTSGGIRVYRDGIRVYDFGEPGNDWLELGVRRVNSPAVRLSNNLVIGAVALSAPESRDLVEKTNREGFIENEAFESFRNAIRAAVTAVEAERNIDKERIRTAYSGKKSEPVVEALSDLREELKERNELTATIGKLIGRIEDDYLMVREQFLTAASAGLGLTVVIHELEKGILQLKRNVQEHADYNRLLDLAEHLSELVEGFAALARRSAASQERAGSLLKQAIFNTQLRLRAHHVEAEIDLSSGDFKTKCSRRLVIATLMNLIDNSVYWLDAKWGDQVNKDDPHGRVKLVSCVHEVYEVLRRAETGIDFEVVADVVTVIAPRFKDRRQPYRSSSQARYVVEVIRDTTQRSTVKAIGCWNSLATTGLQGRRSLRTVVESIHHHEVNELFPPFADSVEVRLARDRGKIELRDRGY